jgi:hypothetical protein
MKGRLVSSHGSLAALLFAAAGFASSACTSSEQNTDLDPEGPPSILQVYVDSEVGVADHLTVDDPSGGPGVTGLPISGNDLTYGLQLSVGVCTFDRMCQAGLTCTDVQTLRLVGPICLDANGRQGDGVQDAVPFAGETGEGPIVQVVFKELLDGRTVEGFACACDGASEDDHDGCPGDFFSSDPDCGDCPDSPATPNEDEAGRCLDVNGDGVNDAPLILPGVYTITCAGTTYDYTNTVGDGSYYDPAGNQFIAADTGYESLGPRIRIAPPAPFPTDSQCELTLSSNIKDKDGNALAAPTRPITWRTAVFHVAASTPEDGATNVDVIPPEGDDPFVIVVSFNAPIDDTLDPASLFTITPAIAGTVEIDGTDLIFTPTNPMDFAVSTEYTVTVTGVLDTFGKTQATVTETISFTTAASF